MDRIKTFLFGLLYENNEPSLTRCIILASFFIFIIGTIVDIIMSLHGKVWESYQTFATVTGGGSIGAKLTDKITNTIVNGVWNTSPGQSPSVTKNPLLSDTKKSDSAVVPAKPE